MRFTTLITAALSAATAFSAAIPDTTSAQQAEIDHLTAACTDGKFQVDGVDFTVWCNHDYPGNDRTWVNRKSIDDCARTMIGKQGFQVAVSRPSTSDCWTKKELGAPVYAEGSHVITKMHL